MRPATLLATALVLCTSAAGDARPSPRRPKPIAPAPAAARAETSELAPVLRTPGPDRILVRAGSFLMGSDETEIARALSLCKAEPAGLACPGDGPTPEECDDCPNALFANEYAQHEVYLAAFWMDRTEVTVARYRQCVAAGRCSEPPYASGGERFDRPELPVVLVTWQEAATFCAWTGGRLPTEAEWERAAKGATGRRYPWGNVYNPGLLNHGRYAWDELDDSDGFSELAPAGSFADGRTPDGFLDLAGNVEEWVADFYAPEFPKASAANPRGPDSGDERVIKGGAYVHARPWTRGAYRGHELPGVRRPWRGFRCIARL